jgi:DNA-binding transcriptional LysR family regulator
MEVRRHTAKPGLRLGTHVQLASLTQVLAVAEHLNFRHAAATLGVSQSSISTRIKRLEDELGIQLFERHARGVRLTEAGRQFVDRIAVGIDQIDHAIRTAGMTTNGDHGRLRVCVPAVIPGSFLAELLGAFRQRHPRVVLEMTEGTARDSIMWLRRRRFDLAIIARAPLIPDCHTKPLWHERLLAALPSTHSLAGRRGLLWTELAGETFIVRRAGTGPQAHDLIIARLIEHGPSVSILRFDVERATLLSMIAQGYGVSIAGESTSLMHAPGVTFLPILDEAEPVSFSAIWSPHNRNPLLRNLLALAAQMARTRSAVRPAMFSHATPSRPDCAPS